MNSNLDSYKCWQINEKNFPNKKGIEKKIKFVLGYAILAPSTFNSQPWKCKVKDNKLDVYLDKGRITKNSDKKERFAHISMGAFLQNLIIAADYFGLKSEIKYIPQQKSKLQHIATINFSKGKVGNKILFNAIKKRTTNRSLSKKKEVNPKILKEIKNSSTKNIKIVILNNKNKEKIVSISKLGDFNIWTNIDFRKEHVGWVRNNMTRKYDGMPGFGVNANLIVSFLAKPVILSPIFPKFQAKKNEKAINSTGHFVSICSNDNYADWIKVGMIFEKLALVLTQYGISVSPLGQFIEDRNARIELKKLLKPKNSLYPQLFFRIGYSTLHVPHSPRYPVEKILI